MNSPATSLIVKTQYQEEAVQIARNETRIDGLTAEMLFHLGAIAVAQGELEYSRRCFAESLAFRQAWKQRYPESNDDRVRFLTYYEFAKILLTHEQAIPAIELLAAAQRIGERIEDTENFHEHTLFLELLAQARGITEESTFALAWDAGLSLELEQIQTRFFAD